MSVHTNLLQKPYRDLATPDFLSCKPCAAVNGCSEARRFVAEHCKSVTEQSRAECVLKIMSAATLNIRWTDRDWDQPLALVPGGRNPYFNIGIKPRAGHCPACDSIIYSRRHRLCGVCGQALPADCRFTAIEAERVEVLLRTERQRHRAWLKRTARRRRIAFGNWCFGGAMVRRVPHRGVGFMI